MVWKISGMEWNCMEDFACYGRFTFHSIVCPGSKSDNTIQCFVCRSISVFVVDFTCFIVENVRSLLFHMFPNLERIFKAKCFSLGNLFLLINFQKLFAVSNTFSIAAYLFNKICYACSFFYCTVIKIAHCRDGQLIWLNGYFEKVAFS